MVHFQSMAAGAGHRRVLVAVERPEHRLADLLLEPQLDLLDDGPHDHAGGLLGPLGNLPLERHQRADELHVRLHVLEHLRLEEQLLEPLPLDGVLLDDGDDVLLEVGADVAQPFGQPRGRAAQPRRALPRLSPLRPVSS